MMQTSRRSAFLREPGIDLDAWAYALQPVDHNKLTGLQAGPDDAQSIHQRTKGDGSRLDLLVGRHNEDESSIEVRADGTILDQDALIGGGAGQPQPDEQSGRELPIGVAEDRAAVNRARGRIELVVEEVQRAVTRERVVVGERHADRQSLPRTRALSLSGE